ncbi:MAG: DUF5117 domain-containing protein [Opitutus sp.]|nr:DUF5117 domain-containing protein [Opitutus sp.]
MISSPFLLRSIQFPASGQRVPVTVRLLPLLLLGLMLSACSKSAEKSEDKDKKTKTIAEVTKTAEKIDGLFPIFRDKKTGKTHLQLTKAQLGQEFILFAYTENGVAQVGHFRGNYRDQGVIAFRKDYDKIAIVSRNTSFYFDPASPLSRASAANVTDATLVVQKIVAEDEKLGLYLIEAEGVFLSDNLHQVKDSDPEKKDYQRFALGKLSADKTRFAAIRNYPANSDFIVEYVYEEKAPTGRTDDDVTDPRYVSLLLQYSLVAMPANDYQPRIADERIGYFTTRSTDMTSTSATPYRDLVHRWNLKKKDPTAAISDPVEPITWWIENTTPKELRPTIREAALQWNKAFAKAGFSNALVIQEQPDDAKWDAGDIRYNVLRWTSSPNPPFGGYGPSFVNPRTGQIIGADVMLEWTFVTNRMKIDRINSDTAESFDRRGRPRCELGDQLHASMLAGVHALKFDGAPDLDQNRLLKEGIYYLVIHELGHTLGLNHNMKSSQLHDARKVHDAAITEEVGLTGSVMDYPAVNLAPVGVKQGQFYTTAPGPYDHWAIEFGYSDKVRDAAYRKDLLARSVEPELSFGNDADDMRSPGRGIDPRVMIGDMSSDAVGYAADRIDRVKQTMGRAFDRYTGEGGSYHELRDAYMILLGEEATAARVISRYIGGVLVERAAPGQTNAPQPLTPVPAELQRRAMRALSEKIFAPDALTVPEKLLAHARLMRRDFDFSERNEDLPLHQSLLRIQTGALDHLLHPKTLARLSDSALYGRSYPLGDMLDALTAAIFHADRNNNVNTIRRDLQAEYVKRLIEIVGGSGRFDHLALTAAWVQLQTIRDYSRQSEVRSEPATFNHRRYLLWRIDKALDLIGRQP